MSITINEILAEIRQQQQSELSKANVLRPKILKAMQNAAAGVEEAISS